MATTESTAQPELPESSAYKPHLQKSFQYGTVHSLQTLKITIPYENSLVPSHREKFFLIYIHGGAWRAPNQSAEDFDPAADLLIRDSSDGNLNGRIAGFVGINYGLSASPGRPSEDPGRNYVHPQHINDVLLALSWLKKEWKVGSTSGWNYVLMGHSCGATMAFQIAASDLFQEHGIRLPVAVLGIEGIYDLPLLVKTHESIPAYREFVVGAFGEDEESWKKASPAHFGNRLQTMVKHIDTIVIAHSREDELVETGQATLMIDALGAVAGTKKDKDKISSITLNGTHDEVWKKGAGVQKAVVMTLRHMVKNLEPVNVLVDA
jgi:kynurenine formamidase